MDLITALVFVVIFVFGVVEICRLLFKATKAAKRLVGAPSDVAINVNNTPVAATCSAAAAKVHAPKFIGRYANGSTPELTPWEDLPKYGGATGWFGFAKYSDVVVPNVHHYPSVAYMDTPLKQYVYDIMAARKDTINELKLKKMGLFKSYGGLLFFPLMLTIAAAIRASNPLQMMAIIWAVTALFYLSAIFYFGPASMRANRHCAEGHRNMTKADWQEVYANVVDERRHNQAKRRGLPRYRGSHHISSSRYSGG